MRVAIIIPCYNEAQSITGVLRSIESLQKQTSHQLVALPVNDCSTDNTLQVLRESGAFYINLPINLGIGGAVQTGFKYALYQNFDAVIQVDGDGQHPVMAIPDLLQPLADGTADVTIGSRFIEKTGFQSTVMRRAGIRVIRNAVTFFTKKRISDPTSGFRAYNKKSLAVLAEEYPDDFPEPVALVPLLLSGMRVKELPVIMNERQGGESSIKRWKTIYYMLKVVIAIFFSYLKHKVYGKRSAL